MTRRIIRIIIQLFVPHLPSLHQFTNVLMPSAAHGTFNLRATQRHMAAESGISPKCHSTKPKSSQRASLLLLQEGVAVVPGKDLGQRSSFGPRRRRADARPRGRGAAGGSAASCSRARSAARCATPVPARRRRRGCSAGERPRAAGARPLGRQSRTFSRRRPTAKGEG